MCCWGRSWTIWIVSKLVSLAKFFLLIYKVLIFCSICTHDDLRGYSLYGRFAGWRERSLLIGEKVGEKRPEMGRTLPLRGTTQRVLHPQKRTGTSSEGDLRSLVAVRPCGILGDWGREVSTAQSETFGQNSSLVRSPPLRCGDDNTRAIGSL